MFCMTCATCSGVRVPVHPPWELCGACWYGNCLLVIAVAACWDAPGAVAWLAVSADVPEVMAPVMALTADARLAVKVSCCLNACWSCRSMCAF
jgi:hypothetical protein